MRRARTVGPCTPAARKTDRVRYEILNMLEVPEAMGSEYVGVWTVTPVELAEPG